jgi:hypothetical protein
VLWLLFQSDFNYFVLFFPVLIILADNYELVFFVVSSTRIIHATEKSL